MNTVTSQLGTHTAQAESTRQRILHAAYEEMYEHGFQGLRIEAVLKKTQLAKGALYHYFPTKLALGYAVVDELIATNFHDNWQSSMQQLQDPLQALTVFFQEKLALLQSGEFYNGCPMNNLIQEMSTLDDGFHQRLRELMISIVCTVSAALTESQTAGKVRADVNPHSVAAFLFSSYQGVMGASKCMQSPELTQGLFQALCDYVEALRA